MKYHYLAGTGIQVSQLSLGTMMFGGQTSEKDSFSIMDYAYEHGVNFFDTANVYNGGESERVVGKWMKDHREHVILATKVFGQMGPDPNSAGLSRRNILAAADASLKRLDTEYIDIYYLHAPDRHTDIEETMDAMNDLVKAGKIRYIGVSNYAAWQIADILHICDKRNYAKPVITENVYNLITRGIESELVPFLQNHKVGLSIYNPIAGGLLAGKHKPGKPAENTRFANSKEYYDRYWSDKNFAAIEELGEIAARYNVKLLELAMKWCAVQPAVTSIISGVSQLEQIRQNIASLAGDPLPEEAMEESDRVWKNLAGNSFSYIR
ncbi:aldo/keto reductase [Lachnoclostridium sp. An169]|nr:aldo/keto reductase [Lachnoclostridium sp. An169]OUP80905.1 aldo/keto reductase [Lachnoclostridium sp. An169]